MRKEDAANDCKSRSGQHMTWLTIHTKRCSEQNGNDRCCKGGESDQIEMKNGDADSSVSLGLQSEKDQNQRWCYKREENKNSFHLRTLYLITYKNELLG
jgi:hypothetical protein